MSEMCKEVDEYVIKRIEEAVENEVTSNILKLLRKNKTGTEIVDLLEYSLEKVTKVAKDNGFVTA